MDQPSQAPSVGNTRQNDEDKHAKSKERQRHAQLEEKRKQRQQQERHEAYLSELAWVRSGGILRDARGRRDKVRTVWMQEEIRLQDEEKRIMDQWNAYELRWKALNASRGPVTWGDIPWPSSIPPNSSSDLTHEAVSEFILSTLKVRGATGSHRERIRSSLLRWHPDKMSALISRVQEEERDEVREGINAAFRSLKQLQDEGKQACC
ncbi:uncharacterized protein PHACADRAFT_254376 [Phanerochaete carnosa HHB-10118-sp]|uniref:J domain-containing protein n=1 Tax=Phanerochaete carnosa (strain HHB-10118-sp) TaxID=650164 RepID=K5VZF3_PHACS|nr:uncharacterized protein PHACADRAFT_254376 [Phanerochaete carnosa HHB-10118-sp]EKM56958.1 hypothetical protein PHACADRAFT_254376 [Phanerochaete carnosa HHB-10118-sp]